MCDWPPLRTSMLEIGVAAHKAHSEDVTSAGSGIIQI
jgi:hypothetical protein